MGQNVHVTTYLFQFIFAGSSLWVCSHSACGAQGEDPYGVFERGISAGESMRNNDFLSSPFITLVAKRGEILIWDPLQAQSPSPPSRNRF